MRLVLATCLSLLAPVGALAQVVAECDWIGTAANILEPWETNSRSFANGAIRIAVADTGGEPACCSSHLMVLSPSGDGRYDPAFRQCRLISAEPGLGFFGVDISGAAASYDPALGLGVSVPVGFYHPGVESGEAGTTGMVSLRINQSTGTVVLE